MGDQDDRRQVPNGSDSLTGSRAHVDGPAGDDPTEREFDTLQVHAGQSPDPLTGARAMPIYQTSAFVFEGAREAADLFAGTRPGNQYGRMHNPTTAAFAERVRALEEGAAAVAFSSGQAATTAVMLAVARPGANVVLSDELFGGTFAVARKLLEPWGCQVRTTPMLAGSLEAVIDDDTVAVWVESIANPSGTVPDLPALARTCRAAGVPLIVDNTFGAGGFLCRPLRYGANVVVHSATKWIGGHGAFIAGVVVDGGNFDWGERRFPAFHTPDSRGRTAVSSGRRRALAARVHELGLTCMGMTLSPHDAFLGLQGLETLSLRVAKQSSTALHLAKWLAAQPGVTKVIYPGLPDHPSHATARRILENGYGGVLAFETDTVERAFGFLDRVELASHLANVGDARTVVINPWTTTHSGLPEEARLRAGVTPTLVRVSVGLEAASDIEADFQQALADESIGRSPVRGAGEL